MALKVADRVRENTSTTGTSALSLGGAPTGFRTFSSALSNSDQTYYVIEENDKYEVGIGTYSSSSLERNFVLKSSNSDNKIDLGGSGAVFISYPADKSVYKDQESQVVVGASGLLFSNATIIKDATVTELTDINSSGTPSSSHIMTFDFTDKSLLIGDGTGNIGSKSVILGDGAGNTTSPNNVVIIGADAATEGVSVVDSIFVGAQAGPTRSDVSNAPYHSVVMGYSAADEVRHESSIIGYKAGINSYSIGATALGYFAGSGVGDYATSIGHQAGANNADDYTINIGHQAGYSAGGDDSIWIGRVAGYNSDSAVKSVGLGYAAGQLSSANNSIYLGVSAGVSNTTNDMFFVANNTPAANGSLIKGDIATKRLAIGAADVTLTDTLYVGINSANDVGLTIKSATSQAADLTQWKDVGGNSVASVGTSGVVTAYGVYASGAGIQFNNITPAVTTNTLYNVGGTLYFDGDALASSDSPTMAQFNYASGAAVYASGQVDIATDGTAEASKALILDTAKSFTGVKDGVFNQFDSLVKSSGIIVGNSGVVLSSSTPSVTTNTLYNDGGTLKFNGTTIGVGDVTTEQFNYASGIAAYASGESLSLTHASGLTATNSAIANYASGQALSLANASGVAAYASGNTANIAFGSNAEGDILYHNGTNFIRLAKGANDYILKMNGNVPNWEDGAGDVSSADFNYASGIAAYASGNTIVNDGLVAYASGQAIENEVVANYSSGVLVGGMPNFSSIGVNDGCPKQGIVVKGGGGSGLISATGIFLGVSGVVSDGSIVSKAPNANTVPVVAQGAVSQASNLQEWQSSDGVAVLQAAANGAISSNNNIYASGSIGVGINTPASKLHIRDPTNPPEIRFEDAGGGSQTAKIVFDQAGQNSLVLSTQYQSASDANVIQFAPADNVAMTLRGGTGSSNGRVGIGTTTPAYGLDVVGGGAGGLIQATGILIGASGVGVGTSDPAYPVDVVQHSGVIRASGVHSTISMNADAGTVTFDLDQATTHGVTLGGTRTLALSNVQIGDKFLIRLQQDGTGSRTVNWFNHISWAGGSAPTLTTTAHKADIIGFLTASGTGSDYWFDGLVVGQNI